MREWVTGLIMHIKYKVKKANMSKPGLVTDEGGNQAPLKSWTEDEIATIVDTVLAEDDLDGDG